MWFGLLHLPADELADESVDVGILYAYEPHRAMTSAAPVTLLPQLALCLREAALQTGGVEPPRCTACGVHLDVPPLDACASA